MARQAVRVSQTLIEAAVTGLNRESKTPRGSNRTAHAASALDGQSRSRRAFQVIKITCGLRGLNRGPEAPSPPAACEQAWRRSATAHPRSRGARALNEICCTNTQHSNSSRLCKSALRSGLVPILRSAETLCSFFCTSCAAVPIGVP